MPSLLEAALHPTAIRERRLAIRGMELTILCKSKALTLQVVGSTDLSELRDIAASRFGLGDVNVKLIQRGKTLPANGAVVAHAVPGVKVMMVASTPAVASSENLMAFEVSVSFVLRQLKRFARSNTHKALDRFLARNPKRCRGFRQVPMEPRPSECSPRQLALSPLPPRSPGGTHDNSHPAKDRPLPHHAAQALDALMRVAGKRACFRMIEEVLALSRATRMDLESRGVYTANAKMEISSHGSIRTYVRTDALLAKESSSGDNYELALIRDTIMSWL